ncbi:hypothetical protein U1Q18_002718 [Sarracenia purpurea var. burkii]
MESPQLLLASQRQWSYALAIAKTVTQIGDVVGSNGAEMLKECVPDPNRRAKICQILANDRKRNLLRDTKARAFFPTVHLQKLPKKKSKPHPCQIQRQLIAIFDISPYSEYGVEGSRGLRSANGTADMTADA